MKYCHSINRFVFLFGILAIVSCDDEVIEDQDTITPSDIVLRTCPEEVGDHCPPGPECEVFKRVEQMPRFFHLDCEQLQGASNQEKLACAEEKMIEFLKENVIYPQAAIDNRVEGMVVVQFIVRDTIGCLTDIKIVREIGYGCGGEVQRVISTMPDFISGRQRDRPVDVLYTLPYRFEL